MVFGRCFLRGLSLRYALKSILILFDGVNQTAEVIFFHGINRLYVFLKTVLIFRDDVEARDIIFYSVNRRLVVLKSVTSISEV